MSAPSLPQQLAADLRRNPKKAGLLALLAGVALWFWAPVVVGWFKGSETDGGEAEPPTVAVVTPVSATPNDAQAAAVKAAETAAQTWQQLVQWMDQDPRRQPDDARLEHNPFASQQPTPKPAPEPVKTGKTLPESPERLNLKLTGIVLGAERRLALINGRSYSEGQTVKVSSDAIFVVRQIEETKVTLERPGKVLVLPAAKPRESEAIVITRQEPKE